MCIRDRGLFGIAISTVILPTLARHHVNREDNSSQSAVDFRNTMDWGVRMILLLGVPAAIGIAVLAQPMLLVLFMRGSFTLTDAVSYTHLAVFVCRKPSCHKRLITSLHSPL